MAFMFEDSGIINTGKRKGTQHFTSCLNLSIVNCSCYNGVAQSSILFSYIREARIAMASMLNNYNVTFPIYDDLICGHGMLYGIVGRLRIPLFLRGIEDGETGRHLWCA